MMKPLNLLCIFLFLFTSCGFPSRKMSKTVALLQPNFYSIRSSIINENIDSNMLAQHKMRIPHYSTDTTIHKILTKARVHNYCVINGSAKTVRLDWLGEKYSYYLFLGLKDRQMTKETVFKGNYKYIWLSDSVLLQRHYTPLVAVY